MERKLMLDADAFPRRARSPLLEIAQRHGLTTLIVAAARLPLARSPSVTTIAAGHAPNAADQHILASAAEGDAVVTGDAELAAALLLQDAVFVTDWHGFPYRRVEGTRVMRNQSRWSARSFRSVQDPHRSRYSNEDVRRLLRALCRHFKLQECAPRERSPYLRAPGFLAATLR